MWAIGFFRLILRKIKSWSEFVANRYFFDKECGLDQILDFMVLIYRKTGHNMHGLHDKVSEFRN